MKTLKVIILFIICFEINGLGQVNFDSTYIVGPSSQAYNIHVFTNHYLVSGTSTVWVFDSSGNLSNQSQAFLFKINNFGDSLKINYYYKNDPLLSANFPFSRFDVFTSSSEEKDKRCIYSSGVQLTLNSLGNQQQLLKLTKTDSLGNVLRDTSYRLLNDSSLIPLGSYFNNQLNKLAIVGGVKNGFGNYEYPFIVVIDTSGAIVNNIRIKGQGFIQMRDIIMDSSSNFYVSGTKIGTNPNSEPKTWKVDPNGNILWSYPYTISTYSNSASSIIFTSDGNLVTIYNEAHYGPWYRYHLLKIGTSGNTIWDKSFSYTKQLFGDGLTELSNSNLIHVSVYRDTISNLDPVGGMLTLFDSSGTKLWERFFFGNFKGVYDVKPTFDGGFIFCGENDNGYIDTVSGFHTDQAWVVKTDSLGLLTSINNHTPNYLSKATINAPYPNPTNDAITIETFVPLEAKKAILHLFDIHGKELLQKEISKGTATTSISMYQYASGNYLIALSVDDYAAGTKRIVKVE